MPKYSYGKKSESHAKRLLEDFILLAEAETIPEWRNQSKKPLTAKFNQNSLTVTYNNSALEELIVKDSRDGGLTEAQIKSGLNFLENFLGILELPEDRKDRQGQTQTGIIKLWDKDRQKNLKIFDCECDKKKREQDKNKSNLRKNIKNKVPPEFDLLDEEFFQKREGDDVKILNLPSAARNWSLITKGYYTNFLKSSYR
ncbi:hypothetical protein H1P_1390026 [Hyella patelloides LEGE 07179]|uniref:Effector-associated domain-containing protein n=1 Tax=Hyella patelloides LEGE 07179 TaxID=945734 RepID=A0A563VL88_9CYAN|nr:hypothetical protein [Hyella patelloides]VEP12216.1 hypothetical protein H1P_1390026 [Hyella patelloides LEGE 07179]